MLDRSRVDALLLFRTGTDRVLPGVHAQPRDEWTVSGRGKGGGTTEDPTPDLERLPVLHPHLRPDKDCYDQNNLSTDRSSRCP